MLIYFQGLGRIPAGLSEALWHRGRKKHHTLNTQQLKQYPFISLIVNLTLF